MKNMYFILWKKTRDFFANPIFLDERDKVVMLWDQVQNDCIHKYTKKKKNPQKGGEKNLML